MTLYSYFSFYSVYYIMVYIIVPRLIRTFIYMYTCCRYQEYKIKVKDEVGMI